MDNRLALIAIETAAKAAPDGYTLFIIGSPLWVNPLLGNVSYDPVRDFSPISLLTVSPLVLVVHPSLPVKSVRELIALARTKPGEINYSTAANGSSNHLAAELFKAMAGVDMVRIQYKGVSPAANAVLSGEVQLMFPVAVSVIPHVKSGRLRALAVTSKGPSAMYPGLPSMDASGLSGYEQVAMQAMLAPAGTAATIVNLVNREVAQALNRKEVKEKFSSSGVETVGNSPQELAATIKADVTRLSGVIKNSGIRTR